jgi:6-phosphogluconolactonase
MRILKYFSEEKFISACINKIDIISKEKLKEKGSFHIALTGGQTAKLIYQELKYLNTEWSNWFFYFGDERCLPKNHPDLNSHMAEETILKNIPLDNEHVFKIPSYLGPKKGAYEYSTILRSSPTFDLVLLGLGEDGHIASLFPGKDHTLELSTVIPIFDSPKPPKHRVSLSLNAINSSDSIILFAKGKNKEEVIRQIEENKLSLVSSLCPKNIFEIYYFKD